MVDAVKIYVPIVSVRLIVRWLVLCIIAAIRRPPRSHSPCPTVALRRRRGGKVGGSTVPAELPRPAGPTTARPGWSMAQSVARRGSQSGRSSAASITATSACRSGCASPIYRTCLRLSLPFCCLERGRGRGSASPHPRQPQVFRVLDEGACSATIWVGGRRQSGWG